MLNVLKTISIGVALLFCSGAYASLFVVNEASDLDFAGDFVYAINFDASGMGPTIGDATFTNAPLGGVAPGMNISGFNATANALLNFPASSAQDSALASVMSSLVWALAISPGAITLDVEAGNTYRLQLMFGDRWADPRDFSVFAEGNLIANTDDPIWVRSRSQGYAMSTDITASDSQLNLDFLRGSAGDTNYYISALTVELVSKVSSPSTLLLLLGSIFAFAYTRRTKTK